MKYIKIDVKNKELLKEAINELEKAQESCIEYSNDAGYFYYGAKKELLEKILEKEKIKVFNWEKELSRDNHYERER